MNAKMLSKVIEVENRVNTICKCLVLGEADHFEVQYTNCEIRIAAFAHKKEQADKLTDLMRIYAAPEEEVETRNLSTPVISFWTSEMTIYLN